MLDSVTEPVTVGLPFLQALRMSLGRRSHLSLHHFQCVKRRWLPLKKGESSFGAVRSCDKSNTEMTNLWSGVDSWCYLETTPFFRKIHCDILISETNLVSHQFLAAAVHLAHFDLIAHISHSLRLWVHTKWLINFPPDHMMPFKSAYWVKLSPIFIIMKPYVIKS